MGWVVAAEMCIAATPHRVFDLVTADGVFDFEEGGATVGSAVTMRMRLDRRDPPAIIDIRGHVSDLSPGRGIEIRGRPRATVAGRGRYRHRRSGHPLSA